ncbi:DUF4011 domain-containing protein [Streptomyces sp. JJ38]|uniref:DUF4011 domain-containing protein n=1 Tax=Streptomyces sp. JJ38 TaxID=2738128 RepID=UPI001C58FAD6|nr:DUF4011 domain-containing protein [Streptomyces sp. JJ38]MBW1597919.1 hypothetical protein [Streptomyces sp. JJ38]
MTDTAPEYLAFVAASAIRDLNHATWPGRGSQQPAGLEYPGDAYATVAGLKQLAQRLPQSIDQIQHFMERLEARGQLRTDESGKRLDLALRELRAGLDLARTAAESLENGLNTAHNALGPIGYAD